MLMLEMRRERRRVVARSRRRRATPGTLNNVAGAALPAVRTRSVAWEAATERRENGVRRLGVLVDGVGEVLMRGGWRR
jgi:hypothetical protein